MGNSSQKTFSQKLPNLQKVCPRCDLMQLNNQTYPHTQRTHSHYSNFSKPSLMTCIPNHKLQQPSTDYELYCLKNNRHIKYRLYRNIHFLPHEHKKIYITNTKNKHRQNISPQELERQIKSYEKRVTLYHPNIIKVIGIYEDYQCSRCKYKMSDLSILTQHLEPFTMIQAVSKQKIVGIVGDWIDGVEYLGKQLGYKFKLNERLLGIARTGGGEFVGKVWIEEQLYKNQGILCKTQIQKSQYQKTITNTISSLLRNTNIPLNISGLTFKEVRQYLHSYNRPQLISSPRYSQHPNRHNLITYSSQQITNASQQKHKYQNNFKSFQSQEIFLHSTPLKSTQRRKEDSTRKITVFSAKKQAHLNQHHNQEKTIKAKNHQLRQSTIHQLQPPQLSTEKKHRKIQSEQQFSRKQIKMVPKEIIKRPISVTSLTQASTFHACKSKHPFQQTIRKKPTTINKQSMLQIPDHCNPINKIKSTTGIGISQEEIQPSSPFKMIMNEKNQKPLIERYRKIKKITEQKHSKKQTTLKNQFEFNAFTIGSLNNSARNGNLLPKKMNTERLKTEESKKTDSKKRSIEKSDLLKYQSYYQRIITEPLPFSTPLKIKKQPTQRQEINQEQNQQVEMPICHNSEQNQSQRNVEIPKKFLDANFNYNEWKQWKRVHADSWQPSEENNYSQNRETSFRISEKAQESQISEFDEKLFMEKAKEYSELSEGAQEFINKNKGQIDVIDSYLTVLDESNKSRQRDKRYIVQESIIVKGLQDEKDPTPNKTSTNTSKFLENSYLKHKATYRIVIPEATSPIRKLNGLQHYKKLSVESDNSTHNIDASKVNSFFEPDKN